MLPSYTRTHTMRLYLLIQSIFAFNLGFDIRDSRVFLVFFIYENNIYFLFF